MEDKLALEIKEGTPRCYLRTPEATIQAYHGTRKVVEVKNSDFGPCIEFTDCKYAGFSTVSVYNEDGEEVGCTLMISIRYGD